MCYDLLQQLSTVTICCPFLICDLLNFNIDLVCWFSKADKWINLLHSLFFVFLKSFETYMNLALPQGKKIVQLGVLEHTNMKEKLISSSSAIGSSTFNLVIKIPRGLNYGQHHLLRIKNSGNDFYGY